VSNSVPGGLQSTVTDEGAPPLSTKGYWSWGSLPAGGGYTSVDVSCGPDDDPSTNGICEVDGGILGLHFPDLRVTITANGTTYTREYAWEQY
jgi:hypothetical protein